MFFLLEARNVITWFGHVLPWSSHGTQGNNCCEFAQLPAALSTHGVHLCGNHSLSCLRLLLIDCPYILLSPAPIFIIYPPEDPAVILISLLVLA